MTIKNIQHCKGMSVPRDIQSFRVTEQAQESSERECTQFVAALQSLLKNIYNGQSTSNSRKAFLIALLPVVVLQIGNSATNPSHTYTHMLIVCLVRENQRGICALQDV